jgi:hypothetical protein
MGWKRTETMHEYTLRGFALDTQRATLDLLRSSKPQSFGLASEFESHEPKSPVR